MWGAMLVARELDDHHPRVDRGVAVPRREVRVEWALFADDQWGILHEELGLNAPDRGRLGGVPMAMGAVVGVIAMSPMRSVPAGAVVVAMR